MRRDLEAGQTIVRLEQNLATLALAQRIYIINNGHIVHEGPAQETTAQPDVLQRYQRYQLSRDRRARVISTAHRPSANKPR